MSVRCAPKTVLVSMPFGPIYGPSLGLSLLKAVAAEQGFPCAIRYANLRFADRMGARTYHRIAAGYPAQTALAGEWIFAEALRGERAGSVSAEESYLDWLRQHVAESSGAYPRHIRTDAEIGPEQILRARRLAGDFVRSEAEAIVAEQPDLVGFTTVFQQTAASLAAARHIKELSPHTVIVFGGANCQFPMGRALLGNCSFIDAVVSGEGESAFLDLLTMLRDGIRLRSAGNLLVRDDPPASAEALRHLDTPEIDAAALSGTAVPDFDEFFVQLAAYRWSSQVEVHLPFETSRGCWWGAKHHCTFCGLNGQTMQFRSKSAPAAAAQLRQLIERYGPLPVEMADNIIDHRYLDTFIPLVEGLRLGTSIFYEVKANLSVRQLRALRAAGVDRIQPGIESLQDDALQRMRKGVSAIQNIQLLKWCKILGIDVSWNYLWGFPGEAEDEYRKAAAMLPALYHLPAPKGGGPIRLDRYSPLFSDQEQSGICHVRPFESYSHVFGLSADAVAELAYYFRFDYSLPQDPARYTPALAEALCRWMAAEAESELVSADVGDELVVVDARADRSASVTFLDATAAATLRRCAEKVPRNRLRDEARERGGHRGLAELERSVDELRNHNLLIEIDGVVLALVLPLSEYQPGEAGQRRVLDILRDNGVRLSDVDRLTPDCPVLAAATRAPAGAMP